MLIRIQEKFITVQVVKCARSSYKYDKDVQTTSDKSDFQVYVAFTKNNEILKASTLVSVSSNLIFSCIVQGYDVVGIIYD